MTFISFVYYLYLDNSKMYKSEYVVHLGRVIVYDYED
jgi:hypothetical protein